MFRVVWCGVVSSDTGLRIRGERCVGGNTCKDLLVSVEDRKREESTSFVERRRMKNV